MFKKLALSLMVIYSSVGASSVVNQKFTYEYQIIGDSNNAQAMIELYNVKQTVIDYYEQEIMFKDVTLHQYLITKNLDKMTNSNAKAKYVDGKVIVVIGNGKGASLSGKFKTSYCDATPTNNRIYIVEWLQGLWK